MKLIPLTRGLFAQVDDEDFEYLSQYSWHASDSSLKHTYAVTQIDGAGVYMHRLLMSPANGDSVDHVDRDTLNNSRNNLRCCSHGENLRNTGPSKRGMSAGGSSKFKGVFLALNKKGHTYRASIMANRTKHYLGNFQTEVQAAIAYNRAARRLHGEFAYQNPVSDDGSPLKGKLPDVRVKSSRFRGVRVSNRGYVVASMYTRKGIRFLGTFKTEEEAARRWDEEARLLGRPEHKMNFPKQN